MTKIYCLLFVLFLYANCANKEHVSKEKKLEGQRLRQLLNNTPFTVGCTRDGKYGLEGITFSINKRDSNKFEYSFSRVNWIDKFKDLTGIMELDSSTFYNDSFFIVGEKDTVPAYKFCDNSKKHPVWIGITKRDFGIAAIYESTPTGLKEISSGLHAK